MSRKIDMIGKKFGLLTVIDEYKRNCGNRKRWISVCNCDCGNTNIEIFSENLRTNHTKSCGCIKNEICSQTNKQYNKYDLTGEYGIGFTNNKDSFGRNYFYFDLEDYNKIKDYCWHFNNTNYLITNVLVNMKQYNTTSILLHRLIMNFPENKFVIDHVGGSKTKNDNRKHNLRVCTQSNNLINVPMRRNNTSGITGVYWDKSINKWRVIISKNKQNINLGLYSNKEEAIKARKEAEDRIFGEYSYDNSFKKYTEVSL